MINKGITEVDEKLPIIVFNSRDFLSHEFSKLGVKLSGFERVYLVTNKREALRVQENDPGSVTYNFSEGLNTIDEDYEVNNGFDISHNNDRYLRNYTNSEINLIRNKTLNIIKSILKHDNIKFYIDEPVSGYQNNLLNHILRKNGVTCLHFNTAWAPGYMYFSQVPAQDKLVEINSLENGKRVVKEHVEKRLRNEAKPLYVINYSSTKRVLHHSLRSFLKGIYRSYFSKDTYYLNNDPSSHYIHAKALISSFKMGYDLPPHNKKTKYLLYPLHYEPEAVLHFMSDYTRQEEIVQQALDSLPLGYELLLKEHPSQIGSLNTSKWKGIIKSKRVKKIKGDVDVSSFFHLDVTVLSIGSTLAIEAALRGIPVFILGDVYFSKMPGIKKINLVKEWLLYRDNFEFFAAEVIESWYGEFIDKYCFKGYFMKNNSNTKDVVGIINKLYNGGV